MVERFGVLDGLTIERKHFDLSLVSWLIRYTVDNVHWYFVEQKRTHSIEYTYRSARRSLPAISDRRTVLPCFTSADKYRDISCSAHLSKPRSLNGLLLPRDLG